MRFFFIVIILLGAWGCNKSNPAWLKNKFQQDYEDYLAIVPEIKKAKEENGFIRITKINSLEKKYEISYLNESGEEIFCKLPTLDGQEDCSRFAQNNVVEEIISFMGRNQVETIGCSEMEYIEFGYTTIENPQIFIVNCKNLSEYDSIHFNVQSLLKNCGEDSEEWICMLKPDWYLISLSVNL